MAKSILIPTDLRVASLNTVKLALEHFTEEQVRVILLYAEYLDEGITGLLFYSRRPQAVDSLTEEFREALEILQNRFEGNLTGNITILPFHGYTSSALNNTVEANNIDMVFVPKTYKLKTPKKAFNPIPLIKKLRIPVHEMDWKINADITEREQLTVLFN